MRGVTVCTATFNVKELCILLENCHTGVFYMTPTINSLISVIVFMSESYTCILFVTWKRVRVYDLNWYDAVPFL